MKDEKKYDCRNCRYKDEVANFCGFCMMKIIDELKERRCDENGEKNRRENSKDETSGQTD